MCLIRACFYQWEVRVELEVDRGKFPLDTARELVEIAGRRAGLGDFRPNRKGTYGQFAITLWKPQE